MSHILEPTRQVQHVSFSRAAETGSAAGEAPMLNEGGDVEQQTDIHYDPRGVVIRHRVLQEQRLIRFEQFVTQSERSNDRFERVLRVFNNARGGKSEADRSETEQNAAKMLEQTIVANGASRALFVAQDLATFSNGISQERTLLDDAFPAELLNRAGVQKYDDIKSSWEICNDVAESISQMEKEYLDIFQSAAEKYAAFFKDFSTLMGKLKDYISADDDKTVLKAVAFRDLIDKLLSQYQINPPNDSTTLYSGSKDDCLAWAKEMGLDQNACVVYSNGKYVVTIDMRALQSIRDSLARYGDTMSCNSAEWQAWMAGTDMHKEDIQNSMQVLAQKYTSANTTFDNLVKVLSSTISSLSEVDKAFIANLR